MAFGGHGTPAVSWWGSSAPATGPTGTAAIYIGCFFWPTVPGRLFGFRRYRAADDFDIAWALLMDDDGHTMIGGVAFGDFQNGSAEAWQQVWIRPTLRLVVDKIYRLSVFLEHGKRFQTTGGLSGTNAARNGIKMNEGFNSTNIAAPLISVTKSTVAYGIDVLFQPD